MLNMKDITMTDNVFEPSNEDNEKYYYEKEENCPICREKTGGFYVGHMVENHSCMSAKTVLDLMKKEVEELGKINWRIYLLNQFFNDRKNRKNRVVPKEVLKNYENLKDWTFKMNQMMWSNKSI